MIPEDNIIITPHLGGCRALCDQYHPDGGEHVPGRGLRRHTVRVPRLNVPSCAYGYRITIELYIYTYIHTYNIYIYVYMHVYQTI